MLTRKIRKVGVSRCVAIPADLADLCGFEFGDTVEFEYMGVGSIKITRKVPREPEPDLEYQEGEG